MSDAMNQEMEAAKGRSISTKKFVVGHTPRATLPYDVTRCLNHRCPVRGECLRYMHKPAEVALPCTVFEATTTGCEFKIGIKAWPTKEDIDRMAKCMDEMKIPHNWAPQEENEFEPCADCDLPDACSDFCQCAIKAGLRPSPNLW